MAGWEGVTASQLAPHLLDLKPEVEVLRKLILPLLERMGFADVRELHQHGQYEEGRDFSFADERPTGPELVVGQLRLGGPTPDATTKLLNDLDNALGAPVCAVGGGEARRAVCAWGIVTGSLTRNAGDARDNLLRNRPYGAYKIVDGPLLAEWIIQYDTTGELRAWIESKTSLAQTVAIPRCDLVTPAVVSAISPAPPPPDAHVGAGTEPAADEGERPEQDESPYLSRRMEDALIRHRLRIPPIPRRYLFDAIAHFLSGAGDDAIAYGELLRKAVARAKEEYGTGELDEERREHPWHVYHRCLDTLLRRAEVLHVGDPGTRITVGPGMLKQRVAGIDDDFRDRCRAQWITALCAGFGIDDSVDTLYHLAGALEHSHAETAQADMDDVLGLAVQLGLVEAGPDGLYRPK